MSIIEILNNELCPDITNIILEYNMPKKENMKLLQVATNEILEKSFRGYKKRYSDVGYTYGKLKYYDVLFNNRINNFKQHKLYYKTNQIFNAVIFAFSSLEGRKRLSLVMGTDMSIICNGDDTIRATYKNRETHKADKIMKKLYKIYLNIISPIITKW